MTSFIIMVYHPTPYLISSFKTECTIVGKYSEFASCYILRFVYVLLLGGIIFITKTERYKYIKIQLIQNKQIPTVAVEARKSNFVTVCQHWHDDDC